MGKIEHVPDSPRSEVQIRENRHTPNTFVPVHQETAFEDHQRTDEDQERVDLIGAHR
jgi:hypothetical protein